MTSQAIKIAQGGKLAIPARFRRELGIEIGDTVIVEMAGDELHVRSRKAAILRSQGIMRGLVADGERLVDELIAERRTEAAGEEPPSHTRSTRRRPA